MCGIVGTLEFGPRAERPESIARMVAAVAHRGPDGSRVDIAPPVALGHARLRVIDLSESADQPMWSEDRLLGLVFNGEIYNYRELRQELNRDGALFRTQSDTEVILKLYEREGERAFARLDGMFALALWDGRKKRLLLARDRAGKKPLFYYRDGRRLVFGSEVKGLAAHPEVPRQPDLDALPLYLTYGYFPSPLTGYRGIQKLPPATILEVDASGACTERRYWAPPYQLNGIPSREEAASSLRHLLEQAVRKRLVADVPLGAFLSGGLDSTLVVGLMSRELSRPVRTFSIGFEDAPDYDETVYAEMAAAAFKTEHTTFRVRPPEGDLIERLVHHHDGPFGDSSAIPTYIVSELARRQVTVVLNGDGGDELFAGYHRFAATVAAERLPGWLRQIGAGLAHLLPEPAHWAHPLKRAKRFLLVAPKPLPDRYRIWSSFFPDAPRTLLSLARPEPAERAIAEHFLRPLEEAAAGTPLARLLYLNFCTYLAEDLLVKMDRSTMAHGLEARSPFLDTALVEFAGRLPDSFKLRGTTTKVILREAFKDVFPEAIRRRGKMGFGVPLGAWFRDPLRTYLVKHLDSSNARIYQHLRREVVAGHLAQHLSGERDFGQRLFCLLTLELWLRSF